MNQRIPPAVEEVKEEDILRGPGPPQEEMNLEEIKHGRRDIEILIGQCIDQIEEEKEWVHFL